MGVPALFRWLSTKYPKIVDKVIEERPQEVDGVEIPVDTTKPNPNGLEFDNLYLDMNGIVHPCSHPEDKPAPATEEAMMLEIFKYTDRVVNMVRPRKVLMLAVDGVAPRAKMNQQRSRRFRAVQEAKEKDADKAELLKMLKSQSGGILQEGAEETIIKKTWDSNSITPGTPFMFKLAACLRYWCAYKINTDPGWENMKVIISDASVPGEGEHKIMEFIRSQRADPFHDPNTRHVIYGLDADLIMLGLATHEPHFHVLREDVFFQEAKARTCRLCGQKGHFADQCRGEAKEKEGDYDEKDKGAGLKPFIWLHVSILREYLAAELQVQVQFPWDLERALDDWVFMCFFVGNDFLPHLPSLDIKENGIDTLIAIWRDNLPLMGGYVTKDGQVDLARAQYILNGLAKQEDAIFKKRREIDQRKEENAKRRKLEQENRNRKFPRRSNTNPVDNAPPADADLFAPGKGETIRDLKPLTHDMVVNRNFTQQADQANKSAAAALKSRLIHKPSENGTSSNGTESNSKLENSPASALGKRKADVLDEDGPSTPGRKSPAGTETPAKSDPESAPDTVRLWEDGYADRYYEQKFKRDPEDIAFRNGVARSYVEGLSWVLLYYMQGCPSWTWYYPYHYAPFAADFVDLDQMHIKFDKGRQFRPYEQLMGVLPAASNHAIPDAFKSLMTDEDSEIIDFYPEDFPVDMNGKKWAWQGVVILPFIDEKRLLDAMAKRYPLLSAEEAERNEFGRDVLIFSDKNPLYDNVTSNFYSKRQGAPKYKLDSKISRGLAGKIEKNPDYLPQSNLAFPLDAGGMPDLEEDHSLSVFYHPPISSNIHKSMLLAGLKLDPPALDRSDIEATKGRARNSGRTFGGAPLRNGNHNGNNYHSRRSDGPPINYAAGPPQDQRPNPFAQHIQPGFVPPPHISNRDSYGRPPFPPHPPPQNFSQSYPPPGQGGYGGPHAQNYAPQPPPMAAYQGYQGNQGNQGMSDFARESWQGQGRGQGGQQGGQGFQRGYERPERPLPEGYGWNRR